MEAWDEFLQAIEKTFGRDTINQWVRPLKIHKFDARNLYLETTDSLQIEWFEEHIRPRLKSEFYNNNGRPIQVHFAKPTLTKTTESSPSTYRILADRLDPELSFENFIVCQENKMAAHILRNPTFNPIYISGPKHTGKTHLLTSTALNLQAQGKKVFYVRAETFTSHVVQAIRLGLMRQFREIYRSIDVLLVDGIDFLAGKNATQEEFFHTFNTLHTIGKQIIISASTSPAHLTQIEPRLMSRFEWGISLQIGPPPPSLLLASKALLWKAPYSEELLAYIAKTFYKDPLLALQALMLRAKGPITVSTATGLLQDLISEEKEKSISPEKIITKTAHYFGILPEDILGKSQSKEHSLPRQIAMFFCREELQLSFQKIGTLFGRDHSTVMANVRGVKQNIEENKIDLKELKEKLYL
jgi:chromosomal replication initiator protein